MQRKDALVKHEELTEVTLAVRGGKNFSFLKHAQINDALPQTDVDTSDPIGKVLKTYLEAAENISTLGSNVKAENKSFLVIKELTCYAPLDHPQFDTWARQFRHAILVRKPIDALASFKKVGVEGGGTAYFDVSEAGFREAWLLRSQLAAICGPENEAIFLDADNDLLANTRGTLTRLCDHAGVDFDPGMLTWSSGPVEEWQKLKGWHTGAEQSTGFHAAPPTPDEMKTSAAGPPEKRSKRVDYRADPEVIEGAAACDPYYRAVLQGTIKLA
ncbi:hypothetical protein CYMTET_35008 [Cymbomonas tetramitiformis]|uniref:Sulfotransferase n=1 Tax=Cymbomonas tetramitiformis TaxID=36881 RepID=A0AAE0FA42_9CHLO|nr:hypothetical protein CYMTET_35008 [Cymbomonas tetramitiformis]